MIGRYGDDDQRARWLPDLCSAEALGSYCLTEPGAGSDAAALGTRAVRDGDHYVLTGTKQFISARAPRRSTSSWPGPPTTGPRACPRSSSTATTPASPSGPTRPRWAGTPNPPGRSSSTGSASPPTASSAARATASASR
ncbi:acyl-CoA dehydrogenase family protein [Nocardiopsis sp. CNR-923]|uniref:acyl-CoA dehydrogenase family protein n=1 Tax=Nocardiopsis sp. CNR-923 TaxID=1904965 RepID=UPI002916CA6A|nr:acyl-CoA dehydrogenase family protein [Nocardiopsis sp. CNR-923]